MACCSEDTSKEGPVLADRFRLASSTDITMKLNLLLCVYHNIRIRIYTRVQLYHNVYIMCCIEHIIMD